jgi:hypothetical protein
MKNFELLLSVILTLIVTACGPIRDYGDPEFGGEADLRSQACEGLNCATASVAWDPNPETDIVGYKVYISSVPGVYGAPILVDAQQNSITFDHLFKGQDYYFVVVATNVIGDSPASDEVKFTTGQ